VNLSFCLRNPSSSLSYSFALGAQKKFSLFSIPPKPYRVYVRLKEEKMATTKLITTD